MTTPPEQTAHAETPQSAAAEPVRVEGRPAPEYGEYAPPGWVSPVAPAPEPSTAQTPAQQVRASAAPQRPGAPTFDAPPPTGAPVPGAPPKALRNAAFNRFATLGLIVYGLYDVVRSALESDTFVTTYVAEFRSLGYLSGAFESTAALQLVGVVSAAASVPIFLITMIVAIRRLRAGKRSWLVLLIVGLAVNVVTVLVVVGVVMGDSSFVGA
ncbi:hypothetical protein EDF46_2145 [Frondihabitans sp. PhB188]|uniref:DUF6264 family protein n=1 Tax=Frondihabitans sp. PhB188 TaxID=2485200 RepID=UPI000F4AE77D|nr:DUF6264 family protein [Frondihabitans sp. PhB188]ROQ38507.1 hypothetical protein EDF46_2145 [Frondihabitans sp. PhB188]